MVIPKESEFLEGDIVFRRGVGLSSEAVLYVDSGQYSHVGIVANYQGKKMIIHAVPGEKEFEGDIDRIKMATIANALLSDLFFFLVLSDNHVSVIMRA